MDKCLFWTNILQLTNTSSLISNCGTYSPFLSFVVFLSVLTNSFKVTDIKSSRFKNGSSTSFDFKCNSISNFADVYLN